MIAMCSNNFVLFLTKRNVCIYVMKNYGDSFYFVFFFHIFCSTLFWGRRGDGSMYFARCFFPFTLSFIQCFLLARVYVPFFFYIFSYSFLLLTFNSPHCVRFLVLVPLDIYFFVFVAIVIFIICIIFLVLILSFFHFSPPIGYSPQVRSILQ